MVLAPLGLFYLLLTLTNLTGGLLAALVWALTALVRRVVTRTPTPPCCGSPPGCWWSDLRVQRFVRRVSLLWALVFLTNGVATLWVLARATLGDFLMVTTAGSFTLVRIAAVVSLLWFRRELRGGGIRLRFGVATAELVSA